MSNFNLSSNQWVRRLIAGRKFRSRRDVVADPVQPGIGVTNGHVDLQTGEVLKPEVSVRVDTYEVRVSEGIVEVALPAARRKEKAA